MFFIVDVDVDVEKVAVEVEEENEDERVQAQPVVGSNVEARDENVVCASAEEGLPLTRSIQAQDLSSKSTQLEPFDD